jgi:hypothetical protein
MSGPFFSDPINSVANSAQPNGQSGTYASIYDPTLWAAKAILAREPNKILAKMAVDYSDDVSGYGSAINVQTIVNLVANAKADQTQVTLQQPVGSNVQLVVNRYYEASFLVERSLAVQARLNLQEEYVPKAVEIIERKKDNDIAALYSSGANTAAGASGTLPVTDAIFINAVQILDTANVPAEGRHGIFAPSARADLLGISKYLGVIIGTGTTPGFANTRDVVQTGYFGEIYGIPVNFTTNLVSSSGMQNMIFHESAFALATQIETMVDQNWIPQYLGWLTSASGLWGKTVLRADHIVQVPSH